MLFILHNNNNINNINEFITIISYNRRMDYIVL